MIFTLAAVTAFAIAPVDTVPAPPATAGPFIEAPVGVGAPPIVDDTTPSRRRKAVEISDMYAIRLKIHYIASYATIPIFAAQAVVGEQLYNSENKGNPPPAGMKSAHDAIAVALAGLFGINTVTGAWNWWETRHQEQGRTWRTIHGALMLVADAGFAYTAALGSKAQFEAGGGNPARDLHRNWAEASAGVALVSYVMMWKPFRKD